jgi:zinc protease
MTLAVFPAAAGKNARNLSLPPVEKILLDNGIRIFAIRDELPQLDAVGAFGYGQLYEDGKTAGMSAVMARFLNLAGSRKFPGEKLHEEMESMGGSISVVSSWEQTLVSVQVLRRFSARALAIMSDLMKDPNFDEKYWEMAKSLVIDDIRRKEDEPATIAFERARELIFQGRGYGSVPTVEGVRAFTLDDARRAWARYFTGRNLILGFSLPGEFSSIEKDVRAGFSSMPAGETVAYSMDIAAARKNVAEKARMIYLYPKEIPQATVVVGTCAEGVRHESNYPLALMNYILGGESFNSRLMLDIRVKRGLSYAVASVVRPRAGTGVFLAYAQTGNDAVRTVLDLLLKNIDSMGREPVRDEELAWARKAISGSWIFQFDTPMNVLGKYISASYYGLPDDYYMNYLDRIMNVGAADMVSAGSVLFGSGLVKVVVGSEKLAPLLENYGEVVVLKPKGK